VEIESDLVIMIQWSLFLQANLFLVFLLSNNPTKESNIPLEIFDSSMYRIKWYFTEYIKILLAFASFFLCLAFASAIYSSETFSFTSFWISFSSKIKSILVFQDLKFLAPSSMSSTLRLNTIFTRRILKYELEGSTTWRKSTRLKTLKFQL
jgi:hypothetical protein